METGALTATNPDATQFAKMRCLSLSGSRGTGKSTACHALRVKYGVRRFLVMDPLGDYRDKVERYANTWSQVDEYFSDELHVSSDFSIAYCPDDIGESEAAERLARMSFFLRNNVLIVEEAHDALNHSDCPKEIIKHAKRGRHYNCGLWCISQRPKDISPHLRSEMNSSEAYYLRLAEQIDIDFIRERRGQEAADAVAYAPDFSGIKVTPGQRGFERFTVSPEPQIHLLGKVNTNG